MNKILIAVVIVIILVVIVYSRENFSILGNKKQKTLYERLGGVYPIAAVVNHFSDALVVNPLVGKTSSNPFLYDWNNNKLDRLPGLKFMRTLWVCAITGGPFKYSPTVPGKCPFSLESAHKGLKISSAEFDEVARELENSLNHFSVPDQEKSEVLAAFAAHKDEIVKGPDGYKPKCPKFW